MTNCSTWNSIDMSMRKYFVERKMVECVISLAGKIFATNIATTLISLSHNNDSICMIDAIIATVAYHSETCGNRIKAC